jgi:hypothetical protein
MKNNISQTIAATVALSIWLGSSSSSSSVEPDSRIPELSQLSEKEIPCLAMASSDEKGWGKRQYFWKKNQITFSFMPSEGSAKLRDRVTQEALKWNGLANITLVRVPDGQKSDVRVGFGALGHWSQVGNLSARTPAANRTMNLQVSDSTGAGELRRVTLHEFGHALGLMHEHQNPQVTIRWKEDAVLKYYSGPPNFWNEAQIRSNVLSHYDGKGTLNVGFDPKSIMLYPISRSLTYNFSSGVNTTLSPQDKDFIKKAYP